MKKYPFNSLPKICMCLLFTCFLSPTAFSAVTMQTGDKTTLSVGNNEEGATSIESNEQGHSMRVIPPKHEENNEFPSSVIITPEVYWNGMDSQVRPPKPPRPPHKPELTPGTRPDKRPDRYPGKHPDNRSGAHPDNRPSNHPGTRPDNHFGNRPDNHPGNRSGDRFGNRPHNQPHNQPTTMNKAPAKHGQVPQGHAKP